jgi:hypothetical protein
MTEVFGTCQICLRSIGTKTGHIAHHGYKRPGHGWQTSSCFGAKWRPLEVACDAIPRAIEGLILHSGRQAVMQTEMITNPPAELSSKDAYGKVRRVFTKPEGFNTGVKPVTYKPGYESLFWMKIQSITSELKACIEDIGFLTERLASWKPVNQEILA